MDRIFLNSERYQEKFNTHALMAIDFYEKSIEEFSFAKDGQVFLDQFFENEYNPEQEKLKGKIMSIHMAFLGKTDFKNKESEKNKTLFSKLLKELAQLKDQLK